MRFVLRAVVGVALHVGAIFLATLSVAFHDEEAHPFSFAIFSVVMFPFLDVLLLFARFGVSIAFVIPHWLGLAAFVAFVGGGKWYFVGLATVFTFLAHLGSCFLIRVLCSV
jgi:hypothetical protein